MKKIRVGIIGTGGIANQAHVPGYLALKDQDVEIAALCDIKPEALANTVEKWDLDLPTYDDHRKMLAKEKLDVVSVCAENKEHRPLTVNALKAGLDVLCEKPIARTVKEAQAMVDTAKKCKRKLMIGQHQRWQTESQVIKRAIDAGYLGDIYYARGHALRRREVPGWGVFIDKDKQGGGPMVDIGVHILDLLLYLMGFPKPVSVSGCAYTKFGNRKGVINLWGDFDHRDYTVEDFAGGFVRFENGATLTLEASFALNADPVFNGWLMGTKGGADIFKTKLFTEEAGTLWDYTPYGFDNMVHKVKAHHREIELFIEAVRKNKPVPVPGWECLITQKIIDGIYKSAETGKEVRIN